MEKQPTKDRGMSGRESQALFLAQLKSESCLARDVALGSTPAPRPEPGWPSAEQYFRDKTARGEFGSYWPLHKLATIRTPRYPRLAS